MSSSSDAPVFSTPCNLSYTVELFENERWFPLSGWCPKRLPSDRPHFSSKDGKTALDPLRWTVPAGYEWIGDWSVDKEHPKGNDMEGWRYGFAWGTSFQAAMSPSTFVRRRRWIRTMIRTPTNTATTTVLPNGEEVQIHRDGSTTVPMQGVYSVNNESFDTCSYEPSVPAAASRRNVARRQPHNNDHEEAANTDWNHGSIARGDCEADRHVVREGAPADPPTHADPHNNYDADAAEVPIDSDEALPPSASLRYFAERQATSSVIGGGNRRGGGGGGSTTTTSPSRSPPPDVPLAAAVAGSTSASAAPNIHQNAPTNDDDTDEATQPPIEGEECLAKPVVARNPFEPDEEPDQDAAFYGFGVVAPAGGGAIAAALGVPSAIQFTPARGGGSEGEDDPGFSFQKTLTEIIEDVDRSDAQDQQVWEEQQQQQLRGSNMFMGGGAGGGGAGAASGDDADDDAAFSSMLTHFVSKAKDSPSD